MALNKHQLEFRRRLKTDDADTMVRRYLIHGSSFALSDDLFFELKAEVASHFKVHTSNVIMVGSGKLGFSLAPTQRFRPFRDDSDIDLTIISEMLFDQIWSEVFRFSSSGAYWPDESKFKGYLFRGWIRPDQLPPARNFSIRNDWWEFFRELTNSGRYGRGHKINAGLFKNWHFFEAYQTKTFADCAATLK
jgi:hypothetical protein